MTQILYHQCDCSLSPFLLKNEKCTWIVGSVPFSKHCFLANDTCFGCVSIHDDWCVFVKWFFTAPRANGKSFRTWREFVDHYVYVNCDLTMLHNIEDKFNYVYGLPSPYTVDDEGYIEEESCVESK